MITTVLTILATTVSLNFGVTAQYEDYGLDDAYDAQNSLTSEPARALSEHIEGFVDVDSKTWDKVVQMRGPAFVAAYDSADQNANAFADKWVLEALAEAHADHAQVTLVKVDLQRAPYVRSRYSITKTPYYMFVNGSAHEQYDLAERNEDAEDKTVAWLRQKVRTSGHTAVYRRGFNTPDAHHTLVYKPCTLCKSS